MKALGKLKAEKGIWLYDAPQPQIGHNDVLVKIKKTAICGTDLHIYEWDEWAQQTISVPMTIGHEFMGEIVELGSEVRQFQVGDRVSGEAHITCGYCRNCRAGRRYLCRNTVNIGVNRDGAFAEYLQIPAINVFLLPDVISDDVAAFLDPFGNATHTALSFDMVGEDVLITGAGHIGIMATAICRHIGARHIVITDINEYRLNLARKMGAMTMAVNSKEKDLTTVMKELGMKEGFDIGLEMCGNSLAFNSMLKVMNHGGKIAILGIPSHESSMDWHQVIFKGLTLKGIYGREMFETWYKMANLLESGLDISPVLTHRFAAEDFQKAFDVLASGQSGKVVLEW